MMKRTTVPGKLKPKRTTIPKRQKLLRTTLPRKASGIYRIRSIINGKVYVGSAVNLRDRINQGHIWRLKKQKHDNCHLQNHCNKYGIEDLVFEILEFCPKEKLIEREKYYFSIYPDKFNISPVAGSQLGMKHTEETKAKMREAHKNRTPEMNKHHAETMKGERNPMFGKDRKELMKKVRAIQLENGVSEETRRRMSVSRSGERNHNYGKDFSKETKAKMSESKKEWFKNHPEYAVELQEKYKKFWAEHPEARTAMSEKKKAHFIEHPEKLKFMSERTKKYYEDYPEARTLASEKAKEGWRNRKEAKLLEIKTNLKRTKI